MNFFFILPEIQKREYTFLIQNQKPIKIIGITLDFSRHMIYSGIQLKPTK